MAGHSGRVRGTRIQDPRESGDSGDANRMLGREIIDSGNGFITNERVFAPT